METQYTLNDLIKRIDETERSPANLFGENWSRRYRSRYWTVSHSQTIVTIVAATDGHIKHRFD